MSAKVFVEKMEALAYHLVNSLGAAVLQDEFVVMDGKSLICKEALDSLGEGAFENAYGAIVQAGDYVSGQDTFAAAGTKVYFEPVTRKFSNTATAANYLVGHTIAAKSGTVIKFIACDPILIAANAETMAASIAALDVDAATAQATIVVPLNAISEEDGTVLTKQATTVAGFSQLANKEVVIDIPVNCSEGETLQFAVPIPQDLDDTADISVHVLAGKAANLDALTLDCEVFPCAVGDTANADIQDTAAQALTQAASELIFVCGADGVLEAPGTLSVTLAVGGTNDGDAVYIYGAWVEYTRKIMTA